MKDFYKSRLAAHQKQLLKYLKYVFNDHLVLAATFILGGLGLYYSNFVKTVTPEFKLGLVIIWLILIISLHIGKLASLIKPADQTFLLPKENEMTAYLSASFKHSLVLPIFLLAMITFSLLPLLFAISGSFSILQTVAIFMTVFLLKISHLIVLLHANYINYSPINKYLYFIWLVSSTISIALFFWYPLISITIALILTIFYVRAINTTQKNSFLDWDHLVSTESQRQKKIYSIINLFTDVPEIATTVKRRKYLDVFLKRERLIQNFTYDYLYVRHFLRGSAFGGLTFRLTLIGTLVVSLLSNSLIASFLALLILFLIGFQLLPMSQAFNFVAAAQLYPLTTPIKNKALGRIITKILLDVWLIFSFSALIFYQKKTDAILLFALLGLEILLFINIYLPKKIKKMANF